jgi:hypothetical protein
MLCFAGSPWNRARPALTLAYTLVIDALVATLRALIIVAGVLAAIALHRRRAWVSST